jgi:hypothetical protein
MIKFKGAFLAFPVSKSGEIQTDAVFVWEAFVCGFEAEHLRLDGSCFGASNHNW